MISELLNKSNLFKLLFHIDKDLAELTKQAGCQHCPNGPLHQANYLRKPRGEGKTLSIPDEYKVQFSFCCGNTDCRKRHKANSVRFFDRRVYWGVTILIIITLKQGRRYGYCYTKIMDMFNINKNTLYRWMEYFREIFPNTNKWKELRGRISSEVSNNKLPEDLLDFFILKTNSEENAIIQCLRFLAKSDSIFLNK